MQESAIAAATPHYSIALASVDSSVTAHRINDVMRHFSGGNAQDVRRDLFSRR
jgi:hypothetical protein